MSKSSKIKAIVAIGILVIAVGLIVYNMSSGGAPVNPEGFVSPPTRIP